MAEPIRWRMYAVRDRVVLRRSDVGAPISDDELSALQAEVRAERQAQGLPARPTAEQMKALANLTARRSRLA